MSAAYTCDGEDLSPAPEIHVIDNSVSKSPALGMNGPGTQGGKGFLDGSIWNMGIVLCLHEKLPGIPAVAFSISALPGVNRFGQFGYSGHTLLTVQAYRYEFKVCGIDTILTLAAGPGKDELVMAMAGHVVQYGEVSVQYGR